MGLGGSDSHSGDVGDLSVSISFHIVQNEDRTSPRWQRRDRSLQVEPDFGGLPPIDDLFQMILVERELAPTSNPVYPVIRHDDIDRHPVQPRRQRTAPAEQLQLSPSPNERLLGQLLREIRVAREAPTECVDPPNLLSIDLLESFPVALLGPLHEPCCLPILSRSHSHRVRIHGEDVLHTELDASIRDLV